MMRGLTSRTHGLLCAGTILCALALLAGCGTGGINTQPGDGTGDGQGGGASQLPAGTVRGTVVSPTNQPVADATVSLVPTSTPSTVLNSATTAPDGSFQFTNVPMGQTVKVVAQAIINAVVLRGESGSFQLNDAASSRDLGDIQLQLELPPGVPF